MNNSIGVRNALGRLRHYGPYLPAVNYRGRRIHGHGNKRHVIGNKGRKIYKFHYVRPTRVRKAREVLNSIAIPGAEIGIKLGGGRMRHYGPKVMPKVNYKGRTIHKTRTGRIYVLGPKGSRVYSVHFSKPTRTRKMSANKAASVIANLPANKAASVIANLPANKAASVIANLPANKADSVLKNLPANKAASVLSPLRTPGGRTPMLNLFASAPKRHGPMVN